MLSLIECIWHGWRHFCRHWSLSLSSQSVSQPFTTATVKCACVTWTRIHTLKFCQRNPNAHKSWIIVIWFYIAHWSKNIRWFANVHSHVLGLWIVKILWEIIKFRLYASLLFRQNWDEVDGMWGGEISISDLTPTECVCKRASVRVFFIIILTQLLLCHLLSKLTTMTNSWKTTTFPFHYSKQNK